MALHVDLTHTDWLSGTRRSIARVTVGEDGNLEVVPEGVGINLPPLEQRGKPDEMLQELHQKVSGTHVEATEPHDETTCPFANGATVKIEGAPVENHAPAGVG